MKEIWEIFYNKDIQLLQKNKIKDNDLFVSPIDLNDSKFWESSMYLMKELVIKAEKLYKQIN